MLLPLAMAALTAVAAPTVTKTNIKDVKVGLRNGKVSFHIKGDKPIKMRTVTANNGDKAMILWVRNAVLGQKSKTFMHRGVTVKAHQHKSSVELDIIYKKDLQCAGNVVLKTSTRGIRAMSTCETIPKALSFAFTKENLAKRRKLAKKTVKQETKLKIPTTTESNDAATPTQTEDTNKEVNPLSLAAIEAHTEEAEKEKEASSSYAVLFLPVFLLLGVGIFGMWIRKKRPMVNKPTGLRITHNTSLTPKRSLMIAEVEGHKLLLASSESGIQLIKDIQSSITAEEEQEMEEIVHELIEPVQTPKNTFFNKAAPNFALAQQRQEDEAEAELYTQSGLQQTPALSLVDELNTPQFEKMLSETAEDEILRRKIQNSRDIYLA